MRRLLLTPMILAAVAACATADEAPPAVTILEPPPVVEALPPLPPSEPRVLVPEKKIKKSAPQRTVKPVTVDAATEFAYVPARIYQIATSPGFFTAIQLEVGEKMPGKAALGNPDKLDWTVEKTAAGSGPNKQVILLIAPSIAGMKTNMLIATDRRTYQLDVTSYTKRAMDVVRWKYPEAEQPEPSVAVPAITADTIEFNPDTFHSSYSITTTQPAPLWVPIRVFDIGSANRTYVQFPGRLGQISAPPVFIADATGVANIPIVPRISGTWYEIPRLFGQAELRQGDVIVTIRRAAG